MSSGPSLARRIYSVWHLEGEFRLRSGVVSRAYFDRYLFESDPALLHEVAERLAPLVPDAIDALAGPELGGVPIATVLSQVTGIPALFVRKQAKEYGTRRLAEDGEVADKRLLAAEDVVTSAGQIVLSVNDLGELGATVDTAWCVIDRGRRRRETVADQHRRAPTIDHRRPVGGASRA